MRRCVRATASRELFGGVGVVLASGRDFLLLLLDEQPALRERRVKVLHRLQNRLGCRRYGLLSHERLEGGSYQCTGLFVVFTNASLLLFWAGVADSGGSGGCGNQLSTE